MTRQSIFLMVVLSLAATACGKKDENKETHKEPVRVETITVSSHGSANSTVYSGTITESESSSISFSTAGTVKSIRVEQGDRVAQGQVIGTLDDANLRSAFEIAQATLAQAQDAYNRMKLLHDSNSLPEIKWVDIQQKLVQAKSAADIARNALDDAVLRAPFSGVVAEKYADTGQNTAPGIPVVKLIRINDVKAVVSVPQNTVSSFKTGDTATITVAGEPSLTTTGRVVEKSVAANPLSRTYEVKFLLDNRDGKLLPGMICSVTVEGSDDRQAIVLPQSAVLLDERNRNFVWLDSMGVARKRVVVINDMNDNGLEISSGLSDGEKVIVKGLQKVCEGTEIVAVND